MTVALLGASARANLVINATFDNSINNDPNSVAIKAGINAAIAQYQSTFADNITVAIKFKEGGGLGSSNTWIYQNSYSDYRAALVGDASSADDATALAHLPVQATSPVDGQTNMWMTKAVMEASGLGNPGTTPDGFNGTITLNTSIMNLDRITIDPNKYDLIAVVQHEINEVLGLGSGLNIPSNFPRLSRPQDLFRYSANGTRSYTTSGTATSYFSIDGGATNLVGFNQDGSGDYGDWYSTGPHTPRVQDAFGTPGATPNMNVELVALDVIGYTLVPEPASLAMLGLGMAAVAGYGLRRRASLPCNR